MKNEDSLKKSRLAEDDLRAFIKLFYPKYKFDQLPKNSEGIRYIEGEEKKEWVWKFIKFSRFLFPDRHLIDSKKFSEAPIHPDALSQRVKHQYLKFNPFIPNQTFELVKELCKGFNQVIYNNRSNISPQNFVYSAQTGSAKSLAAKMYISMLENESSILVVPRIDQAIQAAKHINEWSGNPDYCRVLYRVSRENSHHPLRIDRQNIKSYRSLVMTHSMFIKANRENTVHHYYYQERQRDLIIVDERLIVNQTNIISKYQIEGLQNFCLSIPWPHELFKDVALALEFVKLKFQEYTSYSTSNIIYTNIEHLNQPSFDISEISSIMLMVHFLKENTNLFSINQSFLSKEEQNIRKKILHIAENVLAMMTSSHIYYKSGNNESIILLNHYENKFGSTVTLDATANINKYYHVESVYGSRDTQLIETTMPKQYGNLTIHLANGFYQGKASLFKNSTYETETYKYLELIHSLIEAEEDKLLVVSSKKFREYLESYNEVKTNQIFFTHWGNHVGKNEWSECNKVIIIGWNFYPAIEYYANNLKAAGSVLNAENAHYIESKIKYKFKVTQIADDLIQAINRIAIRTTIDTDGNCPKCDVYLFGNKSQEYQDILMLVQFHFRNAITVPWHPSIIREKPKKSKPQQLADELVEKISSGLSTQESVNLADVVSTFERPKSTISRIINSDYFSKTLASESISIEKVGRSLHFLKRMNNN